MLKHELDNLIKPYSSTWEEFDVIEKAYMMCDFSTKEDAAKAWKILFKKNYDARQAILNAPLTVYEIKNAFYDYCNAGQPFAMIRNWHLKFLDYTHEYMPHTRITAENITKKRHQVEVWDYSYFGFEKIS